MQQLIANAYEAAPLLGPQALVAWNELSEYTEVWYHRVLETIKVIPVDREPYVTAGAMLCDIHGNGQIQVSTLNMEHPIWTPRENFMFRVVHDVCGHGATESDFSWEGELAAWRQHEDCYFTASPLAKSALFTEAIGQVAVRVTRGGFGVQKCAHLPQWMRYAL